MSWLVENWCILVIDLVGLGAIVGFLIWKLRTKLEEVEDRHQRSAERRRIERTERLEE